MSGQTAAAGGTQQSTRSRRTVVVTGATGGIGTALVRRFLALGDEVVATGLSENELAAWRGTLGYDGGALHTHVLDVSSEDSTVAFGQRLADEVGLVQVLVNNAGSFPQKPFARITTAEWRGVLDIDLTGTFLVIKAVLPILDRAGAGRIINIGSGTVYDGTPNMAHYAAAKGGVLGLTRVLSRELGNEGITVNIVTPGLTATPAALAAVDGGLWAQQRTARSIHRDEYPEDVVGAVVFTASADAAFMTGQVLNIDGGSKFP